MINAPTRKNAYDQISSRLRRVFFEEKKNEDHFGLFSTSEALIFVCDVSSRFVYVQKTTLSEEVIKTTSQTQS